MNATLGYLSLMFAVLLAIASMTAAIGAARLRSEMLLRAARAAFGAFVLLIAAASAALLMAFLHDDFSVDYVWRFSERALPTGYKVAAFWAGQEGSLLLWAGMVGVMGLILIATRLRRENPEIVEESAVVGTLAAVCAFFAALMLFAANPFAPSAIDLADGHGMNPMLQDPGMIAHPPMLFLGYAGFAIPFALMIAALVSGKKDNLWLNGARRWILLAWLFLTVGIILGAQWAYVELGWGGYWGWDPVENASLLPWLIGTALLHSIMAQQHRGMLKIWNATLVALTYILCILAAYITRSGVVQSVHAFEPSLVGTFFMVFLILNIALAVGLILWRLPLLRSERKLEALASKEGGFLLTNLLLLGMMLATLAGTLYPVFSESQSVNQTFYNKKVLPMALALVALMAVAPLLGYGRDAAAKLLRKLMMPGAVAIAAALVVATLGLSKGSDAGSVAWTMACAAVIFAAVVTLLSDLADALVLRMKTHGENPLVALLRLLDGNHRRYGGQTVHVGILMIVAGVAGSSLFSQEAMLSFHPGQSAQLGQYQLLFQGLEEKRGPNYNAVEATVTLNSADGRSQTLRPQRRMYDKWDQPASEVAIQSSWREDLYVLIGGWDPQTQTTAIKAMVKPLVCWIWNGGWVLLAGTILCLLPRLEPQAWRVKETKETRETEAMGIVQKVEPAQTNPGRRVTVGA